MFDLNALMYGNTDGIHIDLPEDLGNRLVENSTDAMRLHVETAVYLYGPNPTSEQIDEAVAINVMYIKQRMTEAIDLL